MKLLCTCWIFGMCLLVASIGCGPNDNLIDGQFNPNIKGLDLLGYKKRVSIPFTEEQGFIIVKLKMQQTFPMKFIFDTGAEHTIMFNKLYSDMLNFSYEKQVSILGSDLSEPMYAYIARSVLMDMYYTRTVKRDILILEEDYLRLFETLGVVVDGIVGGEFFRGLVLEINYRKQIITLHNPKYFDPPQDKEYRQYPVEIRNFKPYIDTKVTNDGDIATLKFLVDTGASLTFLAHSNSHPALHLPKIAIPGKIGTGLGGELMGYIGLLQSVEIGDLVFRNVLSSYQDVEKAILEKEEYFRNGLIGNRVLSRFHIFIDYNNEMMYLKPQRDYNEKFEYDKSGLTVVAFGPKLKNFYIKAVLNRSPAHQAGIREGDQLIELNGKKDEKLNMTKIMKELRKEAGKKIKMKVKREDKIIEIFFVLEDILQKKT